MNINDAFPSKYLKATELEGDTTYTIAAVKTETLGEGADADTKPVVYFGETDRGLALNKTNANTIAGLYGPETDSWVGKQVTLFATEVDFQGKQTLAIRIRMRKPAAPPASQTQANPAQDAKRRAWQACLDNNPGKSADELKTIFGNAIKQANRGKPHTEFDHKDWEAVVDGFVIPV